MQSGGNFQRHLGFSDTWRVTIRPGAFDKHMANPTVACLCDPAAANRVAGRSLSRHETKVAHQLAWIVEPAHVADFGHERHSNDEFDTPQCLKRTNDGR